MVVLLFCKGMERVTVVLCLKYCAKINLYDRAKEKIKELGDGWKLGAYSFESEELTFSYGMAVIDYTDCKIEHLKTITE